MAPNKQYAFYAFFSFLLFFSVVTFSAVWMWGLLVFGFFCASLLYAASDDLHHSNVYE